MNDPNIFGFREDCGGRRRIRDRRVLVSAPPEGIERRTNWKRRSGFDRRKRSFKTHSVFERRDVPENHPAA